MNESLKYQWDIRENFILFSFGFISPTYIQKNSQNQKIVKQKSKIHTQPKSHYKIHLKYKNSEEILSSGPESSHRNIMYLLKMENQHNFV